MIWVLVPVIALLTIGITLVTWIFFRSKEKQMMIERGMSYKEMVEFLKTKRDRYILLKFGFVILFFGFGLGLGLLLEVATDVEEWIPFLIFTFTGAGFIAAHYFSKKQEEKDNLLNNNHNN